MHSEDSLTPCHQGISKSSSACNSHDSVTGTLSKVEEWTQKLKLSDWGKDEPLLCNYMVCFTLLLLLAVHSLP